MTQVMWKLYEKIRLSVLETSHRLFDSGRWTNDEQCDSYILRLSQLTNPSSLCTDCGHPNDGSGVNPPTASSHPATRRSLCHLAYARIAFWLRIRLSLHRPQGHASESQCQIIIRTHNNGVGLRSHACIWHTFLRVQSLASLAQEATSIYCAEQKPKVMLWPDESWTNNRYNSLYYIFSNSSLSHIV